MQIHIESTHLDGVAVIVPEIFQDDRGFFMEVFRTDQFSALNLPTKFVQENHSGSIRGVVRGLHFQWDPPMGKLMRVTVGRAFLVAVDIRKNSPTLGQWFGTEVSAENRKQVWAPAGFRKRRRFSTNAQASTIRRGNPASGGMIPHSKFYGPYRTPLFRKKMKLPKRWPNGCSDPRQRILSDSTHTTISTVQDT